MVKTNNYMCVKWIINHIFILKLLQLHKEPKNLINDEICEFEKFV